MQKCKVKNTKKVIKLNYFLDELFCFRYQMCKLLYCPDHMAATLVVALPVTRYYSLFLSQPHRAQCCKYWELVSCSLEKDPQHSPSYACFQRLWLPHIVLGEVCVVMYYICHHVHPNPFLFLLCFFCSTTSKAHESCCLPTAPFCNATTCAKLELIIHTKKNKNHKTKGLLLYSIATFLKPGLNS